MKLKFKKLHPDAVLPSYAKPGDAGLDITVISEQGFAAGGLTRYGTGLSVEIPEGYVGLLFPRSSIFKKGVLLTNSVGVIDSGYRGEIMAVFVASCHDLSAGEPWYKPGERALQMIVIPYPKMEVEEVQELSATERGESGFGSSGK